MAEFTPATDKNSNDYKLDCLAKHRLRTQEPNVIRKWLSGLKDQKFKSDMQVRLNYFRSDHKTQQENQAFKELPYRQGIQQCRTVLRNNLVDQNKLPTNKTK